MLLDKVAKKVTGLLSIGHTAVIYSLSELMRNISNSSKSNECIEIRVYKVNKEHKEISIIGGKKILEK